MNSAFGSLRMHHRRSVIDKGHIMCKPPASLENEGSLKGMPLEFGKDWNFQNIW